MGPALAGLCPVLPPPPVRLPCHLGFLNASLLCVVSSWGLDKNVAPRLLRCLDYVGVFPVGEGYAPPSVFSLGRECPGQRYQFQGQINSTALASVPVTSNL